MRQTNYWIEDVTGYVLFPRLLGRGMGIRSTNEDKVQRLSVPGVWIGDLDLDLNFFDSKQFFSSTTTRLGPGDTFFPFFSALSVTTAMTILDSSLIQNHSQTVSDLRGEIERKKGVLVLGSLSTEHLRSDPQPDG